MNHADKHDVMPAEPDCTCAGGPVHQLNCDAPACPGHYDDDATLQSGAGIGVPRYCNGSCS